MNSIIRYFSLTIMTFALVLSTFLSGCTSASRYGHDSSLKPTPFGVLEHDSSWYETQLQIAEPEYNYDWQILLARSYAKENDIERANEVISQLHNNAITPLQGNQADIVEAQIKARNGYYQQAYNLLEPVNTLTLPNETASFYYILKANVASKLKMNLIAGQNFLNAAKLHTGDEQLSLYNRTANALVKANSKDIYQAFKRTNNKLDRGFYEYALIQKNKNIKSRDRQMRRFEHKYPNHPSLNLASFNESQTKTPKQVVTTQEQTPTIAVFLPLSGKYAQLIGNPTKMGIINAYKDRGISINLKFFDTETNSIANLYQNALKNQAKVIIGPIIKNQVDDLIALRPEIPVIALNEGTIPKTSKIFYLTLAPENDALNAVDEITRDNLSNPLIIAPQNDKGKRITYAFNDFWVKKHSYGVSVCYYTDVNSLKATLSNCFKNSSKFFDAAYIYGTANEASIIREFSKQVTDQLPMFYIGARSNNGVMNNSALASLNGMKLGDQPWLLNDSVRKEQVVKVLPKANGDTLRSFAIGYDSLNLALGLSALIGNSNEMISGLSGNIFIDSDGNIHRSLTWETIGNK